MKTMTGAMLLGLLVLGRSTAAEKTNLDWMAGHWCAQNGERSSEEFWLPARGGLMLGLNRSVSPKGAAFEFIRIELTTDGARYIAQPGGTPPTSFEMTSSAPNRVTFENPTHDYPKRIHYVRESDVLSASTDAGAGDQKPDTFRWRKCG